MKCRSTRFGSFEVSDDSIVRFPVGLLGFPESQQYVILDHDTEAPFKWLQSIDEPAVAFLMVDPQAYVESYTPQVSNAEAEALRIAQTTPTLVLTTASIPGGNVDEMTLNLAAPIVLNLEARIGRQVVLEGEAYNIRHRVFDPANPASERMAA